MSRYIKVYKKLLQLNFATLVAYRANFLNSMLSSVMWGMFILISMMLLTSKVEDLYGWTKEEILLLAGIFSIVVGMFHTQFTRNFDRFSLIVNRGDLDYILLKPLDAQFLLSVWLFNYASISRILLGVFYSLYIISSIKLEVSVLNIVLFFLFSISGLLLLYTVWFCVIVVTVWSTRLSNLTHLMFTITSSSRYPSEMIREASFYVFLFLLPLMIIVSVPTKTLLNKVTMTEISLLIGLTLSFFFLARVFWKFALRFYTSASS